MSKIRDKAKEFKVVQQIVGKHIGAMNVLFAIADADRFDIVEFIRQLNKKDASEAISPDSIVALYEKCGKDVNKVISLIDKQFIESKRIRKDFDCDRTEYNLYD